MRQSIIEVCGKGFPIDGEELANRRLANGRGILVLKPHDDEE
jgi:hypothetical protein